MWVSSIHRYFNLWCRLTLAAATLQVVALWYRSSVYLFDILSHFCWFAWLVVLLTAVIAAGLKHYRQAGALAALLLPLSSYFAEYWYRVPITTILSSPQFRVISFNVNSANPQRKAIIEYVEQWSPDIILLLEVDQRWSTLLQQYRDRFGYMIAHYQSDNFGLALLSKHELNGSVHTVTDQQIPLIEASLEWAGRSLKIVGLHTLPPLTAEYWHLSNAQVNHALSLFDHSTTGILLGDFNTTPNGKLYRKLLSNGLLTPAGSARKLWPTWGINRMSLLQLDHVFVTQQFAVSSDELGQTIGSDHRAVITTVFFPESE